MPLLPGDLIFFRSSQVHHYNLPVLASVTRRSLTVFVHRDMLLPEKHHSEPANYWKVIEKRIKTGDKKRKSADALSAEDY